MHNMRESPLLTRGQVTSMVAEGHHVIIVDGLVLKVDSWLQHHPGGDKAIQHMVGRDATDEVNAFHSPETRDQMMRYRIGTVEGRWTNIISPIQDDHSRDCDGALNPTAISTTSKMSSCEASPGIVTQRAARLRPCNEMLPAAASLAISTRESQIPETTKSTTNGFLDAETRREILLDLDKYPSLDDRTQDNIVQRYRLLDAQMTAEGLYRCNYAAYAVEISRYIALSLGMLLFLRHGWFVSSAICLGVLWQQLVFAAHDAGHAGITHSFHVDSCIAIFIGDFVGGLSMGWWKRNHNIHHIVTNHPEHDPDIEHMPFLAVSHRLLGGLFSTYYERPMPYDAFAKVFLRVQPYTYYLLMLFGRFNLYFLSWDHLLARRGPKKGAAAYQWYLELAGQAFFWYWFGYGILYRSVPTARDRFVFVIVSHMLQSPLHVQFTLSHFAMSTADLGPHESFPQKMLRTTMDVDCPAWLDFLHGGLQFQVVHHLFPRMPRHNLRRAQGLVVQFCAESGIPYALYGFVDCNKEVVGKLAQVAQQAAVLAECQKVAVKHAEAYCWHRKPSTQSGQTIEAHVSR